MNAKVGGPEVKARSRGPGTGTVLIALVIGGLIGAAAVYGLLRGDIRELRVARDEASEQAETVAAGLREEVADLQVRQAVLRARVAAGRALDDLEERNYGDATDELSRASAALGSVQAEGADAIAVDAVRRDIEAVRGGLAADPGTQRAPLVQIVERLEELSGRGEGS